MKQKKEKKKKIRSATGVKDTLRKQ